MGIRQTRFQIKNNTVPTAPFSGVTLLVGEPIVNTADGILMFSGKTSSTTEWTPAGTGTNSNFFEVGSNLYQLKVRDKITSYGGVSNLTGKFLSGTTNGFVAADITTIQGVDTYVTGYTYSDNVFTIKQNNGQSDLTSLINAMTGLTVNGTLSSTTINVSTLNTTSGSITTAPSNPNDIVNYSTLTAYTQSHDVTVTGGTYTAGTTTFTNNTGGTFNVSGYYTGSTVYANEIHVSQVDGNDTTGTGSVLNPVASITKALTLIAGSRKTIIIHPGTYTESPSITTQYTVFTTFEPLGGNTSIIGTVSTSVGCTIAGLIIQNLTITAGSGVGVPNVINSNITGTLTKSGNATFTDIHNCDIGTACNITGTGLVTINDGNPNFVTVNNAGANVIIKNAMSCVSPSVTAGTLSIADSIVIADVTNAVTSSAGSIITLANSQFLTSALTTVAPVVLNGFYSIINCVFDKPSSTLVGPSGTGGSTNSIDYFQYINADKFITQGGTSSQYVMGDGSLTNGFTADTFVTGFTYSPTTNTFTIKQNQGQSDLPVQFNTVSGLTLSNLTSGRVPYVGTGGLLTDEAGFTYDSGTNTFSVPSDGSVSVGTGGLSVAGDAVIQGSLTVFGPSISAFTSQLYVEDDNITLNYNPTGNTTTTSIGAGWTIQDGSGIANTATTLNIGVSYNNGNLSPNIEYTSSVGNSNRNLFTQVGDIIIRNTNYDKNSPDGNRVLAEGDILDGGTY